MADTITAHHTKKACTDTLHCREHDLLGAPGEFCDCGQPAARWGGDVRGSFGVIARDGDPAEQYGALGGAPVTSCGCVDGFLGLRADLHRWLLSIEDKGFDGALELIEYMTGDEENEATPGLLRWFEVGEFVAQHNWRDPLRMYRFAEVLGLLLRARSDQWKRTESTAIGQHFGDKAPA